MVSSAGIEPATTDFVDQSLDNHQDEEMCAFAEEERGLEPHTPSEVPTVFETGPAPKPVFLPGSGQCGNRTRYAELFRLPLYQLSLPTKTIFTAEEGRGLEPHTHRRATRVPGDLRGLTDLPSISDPRAERAYK